jgi:hypothetical protein
MGPDRGRFDQEALQVGVAAEGLHDPGEDARLGPAVGPLIHGVVLAEPLGRVGPGGPGAGDPEDGVPEQTVVAGGGAGVAGLAGQEVLDASVLLVGQLEASHRCPSLVVRKAARSYTAYRSGAR